MDQQGDIRDRLARSAWNPWHSNEETDDPWTGLLRDLDGGSCGRRFFSYYGNHSEALP